MGIFPEKLLIKNYKCFREQEISLNMPDGSTPGSGLTILIGENGNGKTSILEAVNYLTLNSFSTQNKLDINDFNDFNEEIVVEASTPDFQCKSGIDFYKDWTFKSTGVRFAAKPRGRKSTGNLLSAPFQTGSEFLCTNYAKSSGEQGKEVDGRDRTFSNSRIADDELNIFYFDKNRTRQISSGNYRTVFEQICDDLNWRFVKQLNDEAIDDVVRSIEEGYFQVVKKITATGLGEPTVKELGEFFGQEQLGNIGIELLKLLHPYTDSFFALKTNGSLTQIPVKNLGSGVEIILTLLMLKNMAKNSKGSIVYLIDEPELHLHPRAQSKLLELLLEESKEKQIILSTHSPYLFKNVLSTGNKTKLLLFTRSDKNEIAIQDAHDKGWGLFPWSPSWGEVNYFAYNMPTVEFHDELYGRLHELFIADQTSVNNPQFNDSIMTFEEKYLQAKLSVSKKWNREKNGTPQGEKDVTLPTYVRNKMHHPENATMQKTGDVTQQELEQAINELVKLLQNP